MGVYYIVLKNRTDTRNGGGGKTFLKRKIGALSMKVPYFSSYFRGEGVDI